MRILFVAIASSIHTARWIGQLAANGWDLHLFPSHDSPTNPELRGVTLHDGLLRQPTLDLRQPGAWPLPLGGREADAERALKFLRRSEALQRWNASPAERLARLVRKLQPDLVHALEMQYAGYLVLEAKKLLGAGFPPWAMSIWGSDLALYSRTAEHRPRIQQVLAACDYFGCECERDVHLARQLGFNGQVLPRLPMFGGLNLAAAEALRSPGVPSARRLIALKGYQGWAGRALVALRALALCAGALSGYRLAIYLANPDVALAAQLLAADTGLEVQIVPPSSHAEILRLHGQARLSIGLSLTDGLPASLVEAMWMGSFPIQSNTGCAQDWIEDGHTGLLVPPEDPQEVAAAIRRGVSADALVDQAAPLNARRVAEHLEAGHIHDQVVAMYREILEHRP